MPRFEHADGSTWEVEMVGGVLAMVSSRPSHPEPKLTLHSAGDSGHAFAQKLVERRLSEGYRRTSEDALRAKAAFEAWLERRTG
jgi:hypothetical protein